MDQVEGREASALNIELTRLLAETGRRMGFDVHTEYAVPGGRLDVVWTWLPPTPIPGVDDALPVVGFEIESSWRTRKHVKGDLLNRTLARDDCRLRRYSSRPRFALPH